MLKTFYTKAIISKYSVKKFTIRSQIVNIFSSEITQQLTLPVCLFVGPSICKGLRKKVIFSASIEDLNL